MQLTPNIQLSDYELQFIANAIKVWYNIGTRTEDEEKMINVLQKKFADASRLYNAERFMNGELQ